MLSDTMKQAVNSLPVILSIKEVAIFFKVHYGTIFGLIHRNELAAYKDDEGAWCILRDDLKNYCSKNCNL
jgi:excisionase family DNA binding protein